MRKFALLSILLLMAFSLMAASNVQNQSGIELLASNMVEKIFGELNGNFVVGDPIKAGDMVLIPLCSVEVTFGGGLGGSPAVGGGGMGKVIVKPIGFLSVRDGKAQFIPLEKEIQSQKDTFQMFLELFDRFYPIIMQIVNNLRSTSQKPSIEPVKPPKANTEEKVDLSLLKKAEELYESGKLKDAFDTLEDYLKENPEDVSAHLLMAKISGELSQKSKGVDQMKYGIRALKEYEKVVSIAPDNLEGLIGYGYSKLYAPSPLGSLKQAQESFEKALNIDPNNVEAMLGLAQTLQKMGFENRAKEYYQKVLELDPDNETAKKALGGE